MEFISKNYKLLKSLCLMGGKTQDYYPYLSLSHQPNKSQDYFNTLVKTNSDSIEDEISEIIGLTSTGETPIRTSFFKPSSVKLVSVNRNQTSGDDIIRNIVVSYVGNENYFSENGIISNIVTPLDKNLDYYVLVEYNIFKRDLTDFTLFNHISLVSFLDNNTSASIISGDVTGYKPIPLSLTVQPSILSVNLTETSYFQFQFLMDV